MFLSLLVLKGEGTKKARLLTLVAHNEPATDYLKGVSYRNEEELGGCRTEVDAEDSL